MLLENCAHLHYNNMVVLFFFCIINNVHVAMKITKVQNPRCNKCSAVVEKNCLVAEYRVPYCIGPRAIIMLIIIRMHTAN